MKERILQNCETTLDPKLTNILKRVGAISDQVGESCYLVGGAVRDCLLGKDTKDLDLVCSNSEKVVDAIADSVEKEKGKRPTIARFKKFGTYQIRVDGEELELVDPRKETYIYESIKPEGVERGTFMDDALRRDFTLNALYLGIQKDDWMQVVDLTKMGLEDLKKGLLRTPLDPDQTFIDDPSRLFRLARFKACKGFRIDKETLASARRNAGEINKMIQVNGLRERVPRESVKQMMDKGIVCDDYVKTLDTIGILEEVIPEVESMKDFEQDPKHHLYDVWEHTKRVIRELPEVKEMRWSGLFHDIGKPPVFEKTGTFHGHEMESEKIAKEVMTRLKFSNDDIRRISHVVRNHMKVLNLIQQDNPRRGKKLSDRAIRRFIVRNDGYESDLLEFAYADTKASGVHWKNDHKKIEDLEERMQGLQLGLGMLAGANFKLEVSGHDIMNILNIPPSPKVGEVQNILTEKVVSGELVNDRNVLIEYLETI